MCFLVLIALIAPRLTIAVLWFFTTWFRGMFPDLLWPVLGFVFLPTTFLWYSAVVRFFGGHWTATAVAGMVLALLIDLSPVTGRRHLGRRTTD